MTPKSCPRACLHFYPLSEGIDLFSPNQCLALVLPDVINAMSLSRGRKQSAKELKLKETPTPKVFARSSITFFIGKSDYGDECTR